MTYQVIPTDAASIGLNTETVLIIDGNNLSCQYIYALKPVQVRSRLTQGIEIPDVEFVNSRRDPRYLFSEHAQIQQS